MVRIGDQGICHQEPSDRPGLVLSGFFADQAAVNSVVVLRPLILFQPSQGNVKGLAGQLQAPGLLRRRG